MLSSLPNAGLLWQPSLWQVANACLLQAERTYKLLSSQYESLLRRYPELQATHPEGSGRASQVTTCLLPETHSGPNISTQGRSKAKL